MSVPERIRFKFTSDYPLKYGANAAAEFDDPNWPRFVRITDVTPNGNLREDTFRSLPPEVASGYELVEGDILLARSGATVGKSFIYEPSWGKACYAGYLIRSRTSACYWPKFIYWYFQSTEYWAEIQSSLIQATIQNFSAEKYANIRIPSPPLEIQRRIAAFLDEKTAQIDGLIARKQALLERLAEKRQAIITQAVTKGLNPAALMKDSGIDWLGQIPTHWELRGLTKCTTRIDYRGATPEKSASGVFLVTAKNIKNGQIDYTLSEEFIPEDDYEHVMRRGKPSLGDVLFTTEAPLGEIATIDRTDVALAQRVIKFSSSINKLNNYYLALWMQTSLFQYDLQSRATGSTALGLKASKIVDLRCLIPPVCEQMAIVAHVQAAQAAIDKTKRQIIKSIAGLAEYRAAIVTNAVTGQMEI